MSLAVFAALLAFVLAASATPGPNNLMLMASGSVFGFRRTAPHLAGAVLGLGAMTWAVGLGVVWSATAAPWLHFILRWGSAAYVLYIAWRMATAKGPGVGATDGEPVTFLGAAAFQWINPRAWAIALFAPAAYAARGRLVEAAVIAAVVMLVSAPCAVVWTAFGSAIVRWFRAPRRLKAFNRTAAALLVVSLYPLALGRP